MSINLIDSISSTDVSFNIQNDPNKCPSICIPRVFNHISTAFIADIFQQKLGLGIIKKIDAIPIHSDVQFKKIFIHFASWYDTEKSNSVKDKLLREVVLKVVYDGPWFWKCSLSRDKKYPPVRK